MSELRSSFVDGKAGSEAAQTDERKAYTKPEILHELELETRAGSPLGPGPFQQP